VHNSKYPSLSYSQDHASCSFRVCKGPYDPYLISAWEAYDAERQSENDHPKDFTSEQVSPHSREISHYVIVVEHQGWTMSFNHLFLTQK
jgi:hypothetical protein